jgi:uncharacterized membrane protein YphA (DoxX/SURF4 family)
MLSVFPDLFAYRELAPALLRLALGTALVCYGYARLRAAFAGTLRAHVGRGKGIAVWAMFAGIAEFFCGIALLVGIFVQPASLFVIADAVVRGARHKEQARTAVPESAFFLIAMALALLLLGPGLWAIDLPL